MDRSTGFSPFQNSGNVAGAFAIIVRNAVSITSQAAGKDSVTKRITFISGDWEPGLAMFSSSLWLTGDSDSDQGGVDLM
jgi:hypothetical protein